MPLSSRLENGCRIFGMAMVTLDPVRAIPPIRLRRIWAERRRFSLAVTVSARDPLMAVWATRLASSRACTGDFGRVYPA